MPEEDLVQVGPYRVIRELGRGGMGVVWLAHDDRLDRDIAIKTLPPGLASNPERLERFQREARILASLNHPNIGAIHGLEQVGDEYYLILEHVEGQTLAELIGRTPLPVPDALAIAVQLASALQGAHEKGIVHRDIKPGNIICRPDGGVKVLDFGLSKHGETQVDPPPTPASPTIVPAARHSPTIPGAILGTAGYMSPEQARGRPIDKRSDIFSFGCVLYEMLTAHPPFPGETVTESLGATLHLEPDWSRVPIETPATVQLLLRRCLAKDPTRRLHDIADARIEIELAIAGPAESSLLQAGLSIAERTPRRRARRIWLAATGFGLLTGGLATGWFMRPPVAPEATTLHVAIPVPWAERIGLKTATRPFVFDLSPDGRTLAFVNFEEVGPDGLPITRIYLRRLDDPRIRPVEGTEWAGTVSFSPDGSRLAFAAGDDQQREHLRLIDLRGGPALQLLEDRDNSYILWNYAPRWRSETELLISSEDGRTFYSVPTTGGAPVPLTTLERSDAWTNARQPIPLPGGRAVCFTANSASSLGPSRSVYRMDLTTGEVVRLIEEGAHPRYSPTGHILFTRRDTLCAVPFDLAAMRLNGPVVPLISGLFQREPMWPSDAFELSDTGDLAYVSRLGARALVAIDRAGVASPLLKTTREFSGELAISPDGTRILLVSASGTPELVVGDLSTGAVSTLAVLRDAEASPRWLPDGRVVYTERSADDLGELMIVDPADPRKSARVWREPMGRGIPVCGSATPDGRYLVFEYRSVDRSRTSSVYMLDLVDGGPPTLIAATSAYSHPALSPDGRWLAYRDAGIIMLRPFDPASPQSGQARAVTREGNYRPFWSSDGSELFFSPNGLNDLMGVKLTFNPQLTVSDPALVLADDVLNMAAFAGDRVIDIMPDGSRFAVIQQPRGVAPHIHLIRNWTDELRRRVPARPRN